MATIAETMVKILKEEGYLGVMWGDVALLDRCARECNVSAIHPLNRHQRVLAGLERAPHLFEKGYIRIDIFQNHQARKVRFFKMKG